MTTVLAIDQGTSGTKALVVSGDGSVLASREYAIRPNYLDNGGVEQDAQSLLDSVIQAGRAAIEDAGVAIDIVTLANQGESVLAWEPESGAPLTPVIVWQDRRAEEVCSKVTDSADYISQRTGLTVDPYFSGPKMAWLRRNMTKDGVVTTTDTWLLHRLTGAFVTDAVTASRSLLVDTVTGSWSPELVEIFGLQNERFPRIVANTDIVGSTTLFGGGVLAVGGLIVDQQAALIAQRALTRGEVKCTFGTGAFVVANIGPEPLVPRSRLALSLAWQHKEEKIYCLDGQVYAAGSALRWLQQLKFIDDVSNIDAAASDNASGVVAVPALAGLAAPWWQPDATATFAGLTLATRPAHIIRAVLEGIAAQVREVIHAVELELGGTLGRLRVDGGLTQSEVLMQVVADIVQLPVDIYPNQHATALGGVALGRLAVDPELSLDEAVLNWKPERSFQPSMSPDEASAFLSRWRQVAADVLRRESSS